jgi:hypothetical protein
MALTREDLKNIKNVFDRGFERNFGKHFNKNFKAAFDKVFDRKFATNFEESFDKSFDKKFEGSFRKNFMEAFDQVLHPVLDKIFAKQKEHDQRFGGIEKRLDNLELGQGSIVRKLTATEDRLDSHGAMLEGHEKRLVEIELQRA